MRRDISLRITTRDVLFVARNNGKVIKDIREAEAVLAGVSANIKTNIERVILKEIGKRTQGENEDVKELVKSVVEDSDEEEIDEKPNEVAAEEQPKPEQPKSEQPKPQENQNRCPVCDRGCSSQAKLKDHLNARAKKDHRHAEYLSSLK